MSGICLTRTAPLARDLATTVSDPSATLARALVDALKVEIGCESCGAFAGDPIGARILEFHHADPSTKYRTALGRPVHLSDMVKPGRTRGDVTRPRYAWNTILHEVSKCRVLCANCHRSETFNVATTVRWCVFTPTGFVAHHETESAARDHAAAVGGEVVPQTLTEVTRR